MTAGESEAYRRLVRLPVGSPSSDSTLNDFDEAERFVLRVDT